TYLHPEPLQLLSYDQTVNRLRRLYQFSVGK
ncbi:hypothetical protein, partial [Bacillus phage SPG24]